MGSFLTREEFESRGSPTRITQVLQRMSGVRIRPNPRYMRGGDTRRGIIDMGRRGPRTFGHARSQSCEPLVFLDGRYVGTTGQDVDGLIPQSNIAAIEVHSTAAGMPANLNRPGAACGVLVLWTR